MLRIRRYVTKLFLECNHGHYQRNQQQGRVSDRRSRCARRNPLRAVGRIVGITATGAAIGLNCAGRAAVVGKTPGVIVAGAHVLTLPRRSVAEAVGVALSTPHTCAKAGRVAAQIVARYASGHGGASLERSAHNNGTVEIVCSAVGSVSLENDGIGSVGHCGGKVVDARHLHRKRGGGIDGPRIEKRRSRPARCASNTRRGAIHRRLNGLSRGRGGRENKIDGISQSSHYVSRAETHTAVGFKLNGLSGTPGTADCRRRRELGREKEKSGWGNSRDRTSQKN